MKNESLNNLIDTVVEGEVISVDNNEVILDIGESSKAVIYRSGLLKRRDEELTDLIKIGDKIKALVIDLDDDGRIVLSKIKYDDQKIQDHLKQVFDNGEVLKGKIVAVKNKSLIVDVGFTEILMPITQYHVRSIVASLDSLIGEEVRGILIDYNIKRKRAIFSQKALLIQERNQRAIS